jgi:pimeloyl-[acyl-carrier protein] methyl ester esterase
MTKPLLLFVHGWGFDASAWDAMRGAFAAEDSLAWDLGYFGAASQPELPPGRPVLAVGHSFGLLRLLHQSKPAFRSVVSINGFTCFAQRNDFKAGIAPRLLQRMQSKIATDASGVVKNFRALCGVTTNLPGEPVIEKLQAGLEGLQNWDERQATVTAALCGASDTLVTPAMSRACFPGDKIHWHEGGHMLPLTAPDWCAQHLRDVLERLM